MKGLVNINFKPTKSLKPKLNKLDLKVLIDDSRSARPPRLKKEEESLESFLCQPLLIKGTPRKIIEVMLGERDG